MSSGRELLGVVVGARGGTGRGTVGRLRLSRPAGDSCSEVTEREWWQLLELRGAPCAVWAGAVRYVKDEVCGGGRE